MAQKCKHCGGIGPHDSRIACIDWWRSEYAKLDFRRNSQIFYRYSRPRTPMERRQIGLAIEERLRVLSAENDALKFRLSHVEGVLRSQGILG